MIGAIIEGVPIENITNYDEINVTDDPENGEMFTRRRSKLPTSNLRNPNWIEDGPEAARINTTTSSWFDENIFEGWYFYIVIPYLRRKQSDYSKTMSNSLENVWNGLDNVIKLEKSSYFGERHNLR
ncbi:hypothetical protein Trydic_g14667 [Trypoxylus dichotomus]